MEHLEKNLQKLFSDWKPLNETNRIKNKLKKGMVYEKTAFTYDGVLRLPYNKHYVWTSLNYKRILFLLKDEFQCAEDENIRWDAHVRDWLKLDGENNKGLNLKPIKKGNKNIFRPLGKWLMGIHAILENDSYIAFEDLSDEAVSNHISNNPMAIIECKKQPGGANLDRKVLKQYFDRDRDFIKREIELLNPDVIICCDKSGMIYSEIVSMLGGDCHNQSITKICNHTYVINSYHPSYSFRGYEYKCYNYVISALWEYLHPDQENKLLQSVNPTKQLTPRILCDSVRELTQYSDWSIWKNSINIQKQIIQNEVDPRVGIEVIFDSDNYIRIYLAFWRGSGRWHKNTQIAGIVKQLFADLATETCKWGAKGDFHEKEKNIGKPGVLLSEVKKVEKSIEDIVLELKRWHDILLRWLTTY